MTASAVAAAGTWGGFRLGPHEFALPLGVLREVASCGVLLPLPNVLTTVVGAFDLRGTLVPVLDLGPALGLPARTARPPLVLVIELDGRLLGLAIDAVTGTFPVAADGFQVLGTTNDALLAGCLRRDGTDTVVSALSPAALRTLPGLPLAQDRERRVASAGEPAATTAAPVASLLLLESGGLRFALDALCVQSTVWEPKVLANELTSARCVGVIEHRGRLVPAVELTRFLELSVPIATGPRQGFVLELSTGMVVFLVDAVAEIAVVPLADIVPLPPRSFGAAEALLQGVCRAPGAAEAIGADRLVLAADRLLTDPLVQSLAALNTAPDAAAKATLAAARTAREASEGTVTAIGGRSLATFSLQADFAVPLERLAEVLPCGDAPPAFGSASRVQRMIVRRGRTIPRFDLGELLGQPGAPVGCVLVVDGPNGPVGFAVPALQAIEPAQWERPFPASVGVPAHDPRAGAPRTMAAVGATARVVEVLDPVALAARLFAMPIG